MKNVRVRRALIALALFLVVMYLPRQIVKAQTSITAPPDTLLLVHQRFRFGAENARQKLESEISRMCDRVNVPNDWIDLESITGEPEALFFDPFDSFEEIENAFGEWNEIFAHHPELAQKQEALRALETSESTIIAVRRSDLSYQANSIDLSKMRFMRVLEVRLLPGHEADFTEAFRTLRAAYEKIKADTPWVVYQVNVGMPSPAFLAFVPRTSLKQNDDLLAWRGPLLEAEGEEAANRMQQIAHDAYASTESNLYSVSPATSHVSKDFAAGDPEFWTPKASESAQPKATKRP